MRPKKLWIVAGVLLVMTGGTLWLFGGNSPQDRLSQEDCTSYEQYDEKGGSCYYDCETDEECAAIEQKINAELDSYFEGSQAKVAPTKPKPQPAVEQPQNTNDQPTKQYTLEETGSDTRGKVYTVTTSQELSPQPSSRDAELWQLFTRVASKQTISERLLTFEVFDDANNDSAASVWQSQDNSAKWHMNVNAAFMDDRKDLIHTMVHEFGHIVTLNTTQVERVSGSCPRLEIPEGCTKAGSYLANFESRFWAKYGSSVPGNYGDNQDEVTTFYQGKEDAFVTEYAATNPIEDLAETWAYFVLRAKPADTSEKSQKIISLYDYPELLQLRDRIRANVGNELTQRNLLKR